MIAAEIVLILTFAYLLCGLAVGIPFVVWGVDQVDESAHGAPLGFRLLILPGTVALWPALAAQWLRAVRQPSKGAHG
jgi:hypothetical protein